MVGGQEDRRTVGKALREREGEREREEIAKQLWFLAMRSFGVWVHLRNGGWLEMIC